MFIYFSGQPLKISNALYVCQKGKNVLALSWPYWQYLFNFSATNWFQQFCHRRTEHGDDDQFVRGQRWGDVSSGETGEHGNPMSNGHVHRDGRRWQQSANNLRNKHWTTRWGIVYKWRHNVQISSSNCKAFFFLQLVKAVFLIQSNMYTKTTL